MRLVDGAWAAAAEEEPESVVIEVPESEAEALYVLDDPVGASVADVGEPGVVPAQDRCLPATDGAGDAWGSDTSRA
jgi:hypothetical protein